MKKAGFAYTDWDAVQDGQFSDEINTASADDFRSFFAKFGDRSASEFEHELFNVRLLQWFTAHQIFGIEMDSWAKTALAEKFWKIVGGWSLVEQLHMPWMDPPPDPLSRKQRSDLNLFCDISNMVNSENLRVTDAIVAAAQNYRCSYEKARAAYYAGKRGKIIDSKFGPEN